jgi:hypothetical protein
LGARLRHPASSRVARRRRTTSSSIYANVFQVRRHSTVIIGVPTLISFVAYTGAYSSNCLTRLFINLSKKLAKKRCLMKSRDIYGGLTRAFEGKPGIVYI